MFGLFYLATNAISYIVSSTKISVDNHILKNKAIKDEEKKKVKTNTYTDHNGVTRDIATNQVRHIYKDRITGDAWLEDSHRNRIRNLSEEKRKAEYEERKNNNSERKAVLYDSWGVKNSPIRDDMDWFRLTGNVYKDVINGDLYVERNNIQWRENLYPPSGTNIKGCIYRANFYMKVTDGTLVGLNDSKQPESYKDLYKVPTEEQIKQFVKFFNQKQREGGWKYSKERDEGVELYKMNSKSNLYLV